MKIDSSDLINMIRKQKENMGDIHGEKYKLACDHIIECLEAGVRFGGLYADLDPIAGARFLVRGAE